MMKPSLRLLPLPGRDLIKPDKDKIINSNLAAILSITEGDNYIFQKYLEMTVELIKEYLYPVNIKHFFTTSDLDSTFLHCGPTCRSISSIIT